MSNLSNSRFTTTIFISLSIIAFLFIPSSLQAEAFKGGLFSSGVEKAIYFVALLIFLLVILFALGILRGIVEWLQTGQTTRLKRCFDQAFTVIFGGFIVGSVLVGLVLFVLSF